MMSKPLVVLSIVCCRPYSSERYIYDDGFRDTLIEINIKKRGIYAEHWHVPNMHTIYAKNSFHIQFVI